MIKFAKLCYYEFFIQLELNMSNIILLSEYEKEKLVLLQSLLLITAFLRCKYFGCNYVANE